MTSEFLRKLFCLMAAVVMVTAFACGEPEGDGDGDVDVDGKADHWDSRNNPSEFGANLVYNWEELSQVQQGASDIVPWADTYWPMTQDGYNARWNGSALSPAELYDQAFNGWTPPEGFDQLRRFRGPRQEYDQAYYDALGPAASWAHESGGNGSAQQVWNPDGTLASAYAQCDTNDDNRFDSDAPASSCDLNGNGTVGSDDENGGLEGWFGHCHAWAPSSFSHPQPEHSVTVNNVTFEVADVKAMIEATHESCGAAESVW